jgi:hypothetical protein
MAFTHIFEESKSLLKKLSKFNWNFTQNRYHIWIENGSNFRTQYKSIQNLQTLQGYIFRILTFRNQTLQFYSF